MIKVLYAEDEPQVAGVMRSYLNRFAPECALEVVETGRACLERMQQGGWDVLVLDLNLPDIDGLKILGQLAGRGDLTPVIMVSGQGQTELAVRALRAGAVDCIDKTTGQFLQLPEIVRRVHSRHREQAGPSAAPPPARTEPYRVLFFEDSARLREALLAFLKANASHLEVTAAPSASQFERLLLEEKPFDAVIIGPNPDGRIALDVLRELRSRAADTPALMISTHNDGETAIAAFKLGASDFILVKDNYLPEVAFSLSNLLRRTDAERRGAQLARELAHLNRSLEARVAARTAELRTLAEKLGGILESFPSGSDAASQQRQAEARELAREIRRQAGL
ncbi:MAG TPA: response regulator [Opitutaceae bacterium]|nr:response regulator [Opitutaceae bacterium]